MFIPRIVYLMKNCGHVWNTKWQNDKIALWLAQGALILVKVTPKIFGVGFKTLQRTGVRSTRCQHTEASYQGNSEHGHRFNKLVSRISLTRLSFAAVRVQKIFAQGQLLA